MEFFFDFGTSAISEKKPQTWEAVWSEYISNANAIDQMTVNTEIIALAHEIGDERFDTFNEIDVDDMLIDKALSDDNIIET